MKVYFVTTGLAEETEVIRKVRPPRLLCSYWYFKNKSLREFCNTIGYQPEIMLDSGAYSALTKGRSVNLFDYMKYIEENAELISRYVALDVIGDSFTTKSYYEIMRHKGFDPVPVFHWGDDLSTMQYYVSNGARVVAIGNTVKIRNKDYVAKWCNEIHELVPDIELHLLGSSSQKILDCGAVESCDSSAWYIMAVNGHPKSIPGKTRPSKLARAEENMVRIMEVFNEIPISADNSCG